MITVLQYFAKKLGNPECTVQMHDRAEILLDKVNRLIITAEECQAFVLEIDPDTGSGISGSRGGAGDGGFRLSGSTTGAAKSAHKQAHAVDVYDPGNRLDSWLSMYETENGGNLMLEQYGLYREAPASTNGWCHLQDTPPGSGRRTFNP
jgi:hypothetical protein